MTRHVLPLAAALAALAALASAQEPTIPVPSPAAPGEAVVCARGPGFVGGAEMLLLRPYAGDPKRLTLTDGEDSVSLRLPNNQFELSPRVWFGYLGAEGLGVRARYFQFDHDLAAESLAFVGDGARLSTVGSLKLYAADAEAFQQLDLGLWQTRFGGGLRAGGVGRSFDVTATDGETASSLGLSKKFDGLGPTLFAELRRPFGASGFAWLAAARGSLLFGAERLHLGGLDLGIGGGFSEKHDALYGVGELQLGVEWSQPLSCGGRAFASAAWEAQAWSGSGPILDVLNDDVGLMGFVVGAGIAR